jgi:hypothetical protein
MKMKKRIETTAMATLIMLACAGAAWARPPASEELGQRPRKAKPATTRPAEIDRPVGLQRKPGSIQRKPGRKPPVFKPGHKPNYEKPSGLCDAPLGMKQIMALLKGGDACSGR